MNDATTVSVVVCTYNRCESLAETLASIAKLTAPATVEWEVIVVDNNSADDTPAVVERFSASAPVKTRYLFEGKQGLSNARNRAVQESSSDLILFTDDDVIVDSSWLERTVAAFAKYQADCIGGKILPLWRETRPSWLANSLLNVLAMLDYGPNPIRLKDGGPCLYGANLGFKRSSLVGAGAFDTDLGRRGAFGAGEDKEIQERLRARGGIVYYEPSSIVHHKVDAARLSKAYFRHWYYSAGKDRARVTKPSHFSVFGIESYLLFDFFLTTAKMVEHSILLRWNRLFELELHCILYVSIFIHKLTQRKPPQAEVG